MSKKKQTKEKAKQDDDASKISALSINEAIPAQTFDGYQCTGNVEIDFPVLCTLLKMKDIPEISIIKQLDFCTTETIGEDTLTQELPLICSEQKNTNNNQPQINLSHVWLKPRINIELENEDPLSAKKMKINGWKVNEQIFRVMQKVLPTMSQLQSLQFWQAGVTEQMLISLINTFTLCSGLRAVTLEGNTLPDQSFYLLLSESSVLTHLSLRNNRIGDEGARLIGSALSTSTTTNKNLLSLNLAFNSIGDAGAAHIARGLRLNRTLLILSLANNQIGDSGAAPLAEILGAFPLTHEEVVERRKLLLQTINVSSVKADLEQFSSSQLSSTQSIAAIITKVIAKKKEASRKDVKASEVKDKNNRKASSELKPVPIKSGKLGGKGQQSSTQEDKSNSSPNEAELLETANPLLDQSIHHKNGKLFLPGNTTLTSLNLAGNKITEKSLPGFLAALETQQEEDRSFQRLCLQRNLFPAESKCYMRIKDILAPHTDGFVKTSCGTIEEEGQETSSSTT